MTDRLDPIAYVVDLLRRVDDPRERLRAIHLVRVEVTRRGGALDELMLATVAQLRQQDPPATWADVGALLDMTPQGAHKLAQHLDNLERTPR